MNFITYQEGRRTKPNEKDVPMFSRVPVELKIEIERAALRNGRSRNAEILVRLQQSFAIDEQR